MNAKELMEAAVKVLDSKKARDIRVLRVGDLTILGEKPHNVEGYKSENWIILDYTDVIVHVFHEETRDFYGLERLWADGEKVDISGLLTA